MPAGTIRADYDQLKQVSSAFRQNVEASQRTLQSIRSKKETLQGGDWIGQAATAFYGEMDDSIFPIMQRLIKALDTAADSVNQISAIMKNAEDQAANILKGPGAGGGSSSSSAGSMPGGLGAMSGGGAGGSGGAGGLGAGLGGANTIGGGSAAGQINQLTNQAVQAISSLGGVSDNSLHDAVNQLGNLASQYAGIVPQGNQSGGNGLGALLSAIGSPNANQIGQQITQPFSGGGGSSGGGSSGGGGGPSGGGPSGGGPSGGGSSGGGGGGSAGGGSSGAAMQGFSDQALTALMNNPNLPPGDRMLAMAIETLRRDPNAFNGALKKFVDQALGQGDTGAATQAMGGGISALAGAAGISAGGQPPQSSIDAIKNLANQYNNISQGGSATAPAGQPTVSPIGPLPPSSPPPASASNAIANLVQQFINTVNAVIPK